MARIGSSGFGGDTTRRDAARHLVAALIRDKQYVPPALRQTLSEEGVIGQTSGVGRAVGTALELTGAPQLAQGAIWSAMHPRQRLTSGGSMEVPWVAGRPWFHGSSRVFEKPDPAKADPESLYGPGHYITDDPSIASEYSSKGGRTARGQRVVERVPPLSRTPEWAAFFEQHADMKPSVLRGLQTGHRLSERVSRAREDIAKQGYTVHEVRVDPDRRGVLLEYAAADYGPNVTRYAFEPDKVFDVRAPLKRPVVGRLVRALTTPDAPGRGIDVKQYHVADFLKSAEGPMTLDAVWHKLDEALGATRANEVIRRAGYDAIAYPGGRATGGRPHNALVVLNPAPLKRGGAPNPRYAGARPG